MKPQWTKPGLYGQPSQLASIADSLKKSVRVCQLWAPLAKGEAKQKYEEGFIEGLKYALWIVEGGK